MIINIATSDQGRDRSYTGHVVSRTARTVTMLLTEPYPMAGHHVTIETKHIVEERVLAR